MATIVSLAFTLMLVFLINLGSNPAHGFLAGEKLEPLKVATFNVQHFGRGYLKDKPEAVQHLVKILRRYDIVLIEETRDSTNTALNTLKKKLTDATGETWALVASKELGRSKAYLEQYAFFYRVKSAQLVTSYQINDTTTDDYARAPFCVEFAYTSLSKKFTKADFHRESVVLMAIHTPPEETRKELKELPDTIRSVAAIFPRAAGVIALGDMNADCRYLSGKWRKSFELFNGDDFKSLIADTADTTTKESSDCAYDRVVLFGDYLQVTNAKVFDYRKWLHLSEKEALAVSDHYPVEFVLH